MVVIIIILLPLPSCGGQHVAVHRRQHEVDDVGGRQPGARPLPVDELDRAVGAAAGPPEEDVGRLEVAVDQRRLPGVAAVAREATVRAAAVRGGEPARHRRRHRLLHHTIV